MATKRKGASEPRAAKAKAAKTSLTNREREQLAQVTFEAKEAVFAATKKLLTVEDKLSEQRKQFTERLGRSTAELKEQVETAHDGSTDQKAKIYDAVVMAWQDREELLAERAATLHPLLDDRDKLRKAQREAIENIHQTRLAF